MIFPAIGLFGFLTKSLVLQKQAGGNCETTWRAFGEMNELINQLIIIIITLLITCNRLLMLHGSWLVLHGQERGPGPGPQVGAGGGQVGGRAGRSAAPGPGAGAPLLSMKQER